MARRQALSWLAFYVDGDGAGSHPARRDDDEFAEQMMDTYVGMDWGTKVNDYVAYLQAGIKEWNSVHPQTPEEQHCNFLLKRELVDELVQAATIDDKRDIQVQFRAKIIDPAVSKRILDFPKDGEIVVRL